MRKILIRLVAATLILALLAGSGVYAEEPASGENSENIIQTELPEGIEIPQDDVSGEIIAEPAEPSDDFSDESEEPSEEPEDGIETDFDRTEEDNGETAEEPAEQPEESVEEPIEEPAEETEDKNEEPSEEPAEETEENNEEPSEGPADEQEEPSQEPPEEPEEETDEKSDEKPRMHVWISSSLEGVESVQSGTLITLTANLEGFDGIDYTLQWQRSLDGKKWEDEPGATDVNFSFILTEENDNYFWRVKVKFA